MARNSIFLALLAATAAINFEEFEEPTVIDDKDTFHEHLDKCVRCRNNPFSLCAIGAKKLEKAANV